MQAGPPIRVPDASTAIPGGTGNFTSFGDVSLSTTDIAFLGMGAAGQQGIYDLTGGSLRKVVDLNDILNGRSITGLGLSRTGVSGDPIAFQATFADGSQGLYIWSLPVLAGDFNHNGVMDAADYAVWRNGLGTTYTQTDFDLWKAHFGETQSGSGTFASGGASRAVPEPTAATLLVLAVGTFVVAPGVVLVKGLASGCVKLNT
jgi:hypothetical protein